MRTFLICLLVFFLASCRENVPKKDVVTNTYYSKYLEIFNTYKALGPDKSIEELDKYILEFPNAVNAYTFKACIYANEKKFSKVNTVLEEALKLGLNKTEIYFYWATLFLRDSTRLNQAIDYNNKGLALEPKNPKLLDNKTWIFLFKNDSTNAFTNAFEVIDLDTNNNNLYYLNAAAVAHFYKEDSISNIYLEEAKKLGIKQSTIEIVKNATNKLELYNILNR